MSRHAFYAAFMGFLAFAAVAVAVGYQVSGGHAPCALCILQRYLFIFAGTAFVAIAVAPAVATRPLYWLAWLFMLFGVVVSLQHLWVLSHPSISCGRDALEGYLNGLPTASMAPVLFVASGFCTDKLPPLLGLSMPAWGLVGFSGLSVAALLGAFCPWLSGKGDR